MQHRQMLRHLCDKRLKLIKVIFINIIHSQLENMDPVTKRLLSRRI